MTFMFGSRSGTVVALVFFVALFGSLGVTTALRLARRFGGVIPWFVGGLLFLAPVSLLYVSSLGGFYELAVQQDTVVLRYLSTATAEVPAGRVREVSSRPAFRGRWRLHVRDADGDGYESATSSRAVVEHAAAELQARLRDNAKGAASAVGATVLASRITTQNPLVTVTSSSSLGGNVNGPTVIRVPGWVERPLGRYYMYFANHMGDFIRLAYADTPTGPWTIHEAGVLHVRDTAFFRPQPDPKDTLADFYTHVASPEILVDDARRRIVMWAHGWWTNGERWPTQPAAARAWARDKGYGQYTQVAESSDGLHFATGDAITRTSYLRVFKHGGMFYALSRLGLMSRARDPLDAFETGPNPFRDGRYATRVRHLALLLRRNRLHVFFTAIGDAPERVLMSSIDLTGDWTTWRASDPVDVLKPEAPYECADLPVEPSLAGDIDVPAHQIRDPFVFEDDGRLLLYYSTCGEQGIAVASLDVR